MAVCPALFNLYIPLSKTPSCLGVNASKVGLLISIDIMKSFGLFKATIMKKYLTPGIIYIHLFARRKQLQYANEDYVSHD